MLSVEFTITKRFPGVVALDDVIVRDRGGHVPRALRRERRRQEHARQDAGRHLTARRAASSLIDGRPFSFASPTQAPRGRRRDGPPGARVLREPVGRRESLPRRAARRARASSSRRADARAGAAAMLAAIGAALDVERPVGDADASASSRCCRSPRPSAAARGSSSSTSRRAACRSTRPSGCSR